MPSIPYRRLAGFYFFYFAYIGVFAPFFTLYLDAVGMSALQIAVLISMPQITRIFAPHLWGWLADRGGNALRIAQIAGVAGTVAWLGVYASTNFAWLFVVLLAVMFCWSAALPLVEATTLTHLGDETSRYGRIRVWGSVGFIVAVIGVGYALDHLPPRAVVSMVLAMMLAMLAFCWAVPPAQLKPHASDDLSIWTILKRPEVMALIAGAALMSVAHGAYYTFFTIYLVGHGYSKAAAGWLWALGVICEIGIFVWMPHLYRAFSLRQILLASFALAVLRFVLIGWLVDNLAVMLFAQALHAATFGSFHAAAIGVVHKLFRGRHQARGQVLYGSFAFGVGGVIGGLASGYAWSGLGPAWTFSLSSAAALAGLLILWWKLRLPND
ncbi:MAG: MFS transporter [Betaproteobacteria bacterium]|nr:MFS transporter [Betaproteobacteria bacterium]